MLIGYCTRFLRLQKAVLAAFQRLPEALVMDLTVNTTGHPNTSNESLDLKSRSSLCADEQVLISQQNAAYVSSKAHKLRAKQTLKRKAAETALGNLYDAKPDRFSSSRIEKRAKMAIMLEPCGPACERGGSSVVASDCQGWCSFAVNLPHTNWKEIMDDADNTFVRREDSACNSYDIGGGVKAILVDKAHQMAPALAQLKDSMQDPIVAIDLEWRPEFRKGQRHRIALIQLATSTMAVLIRTCKLEKRLDPHLEAFLRDASNVVVAFSWDHSDEVKFQQTFRLGKKIMPRFLDLQSICGMLGYQRYGLGSLSEQVMGWRMNKSFKVTMSNWEAATLSSGQLVYAAMDALMTGAIFRALRLWHSSPSDCPECRVPLGRRVGEEQQGLRCRTCLESFLNKKQLKKHTNATGHTPVSPKCSCCGRQTGCMR